MLLRRTLAVVLASLALVGCEPLAELFGATKTPAEKAAEALLQADRAVKAGNLDLAEQAYRTALNDDPTSGRAAFGLALVYQGRGEDTRAVLELKEAVELLPQDPTPCVLMGEILLRQGRTDAAVEALRSAVALAPADDGVRLRFAQALLRDGRISPARVEIEKLLRSDPMNLAVKSTYALVLAAQGRTREARTQLEGASSASRRPEPSRALGTFLLQRGDTQGAVRAFRLALERGGNDPLTVRLLADALVESGQGADAADVVGPLVTARPRDPLVLASYARALVAGGDYEQALDAARRAIQQDPQLAAARLAQGEALEASGDLDGAVRAYRSAAKVAPGHPDVYRRLAAVYRRTDRISDGIDALERLLHLEPADRRAQVSLAELYATTPITAEKGLKIVERLLDEDPGDVPLLELRRELTEQAKQAPKFERHKRRTRPVIIRGGR